MSSLTHPIHRWFRARILARAVSRARLAVALVAVASIAIALTASASTEERVVRSIPDSQNQIMKFTDGGIEPEVLSMKRADSIVFFLNSTTDSLTTLDIDFGTKRMHCASSALTLSDDGTMRSVRPFGPRSFASACFPDRGTYKVTVYGLKKSPGGTTGTIIVE